ncbi:MAG: adenylate kinase [Actinomycetota bacterium]|nr:adenylate kinase [Actinomycetota bacterium]
MILGKQGAGKGTQAERLSQHFSVPRISTGDMLRVAVRAETDVGMRAKQAMDAGELIPDDVVIGVVRDRLSHEDADGRGFILEGFPRTVVQAEALDDILSPRRIDLVISLDVPTGVVLRRLASRRVCEECGTNYSTDRPPRNDWTCDLCGGRVIQRDDDTEAAITRRLALYEEQTAPLISWYLATDRLAAVDGVGSPDVVTGRLLRAIDSRLARR